MPTGKLGAHLLGADGPRGISAQLFDRGDYLGAQPAFDRFVAGEECAQAVAYNFALAGVYAGRDAFVESVRQAVGESDAEVLRGAHYRVSLSSVT